MRSSFKVRPVGLMAVAVLAASLPGCDWATDEYSRNPVSGSVTLDGRPLESGSILFNPDGGTTPVTAGAEIDRGRFSIPQATGLTPGKYRVSIMGADGHSGPPGTSTGSSGLKPGTVPEKYNSRTTLTTEVKDGGAVAMRFDLSSK